MNLSYLTLKRLTHDLQSLKGARIQDASLLRPNALILDVSVAAGARNTRLLISGSRSQGRICVTQSPFPEKPDRPPWIERYLLKAGIREISIQPDDRILTIDLDKQDRVGSRYPSRLVVEMMGQNSNAVLVDSSGKIQGVLRTHTSEHRQLRPGAAFVPASPQDRRPPDDVSREAFEKTLTERETEVDALLTSIAGMTRHLAREIQHRAQETGQDLLTTAQRFYAHPPFDESPGCLVRSGGRRTTVLPFTPGHLESEQFEPTDDISRAIERVFEDGLKGQEERGQKKDLQRTVKRAVKQARTKRSRIADDLEKARNADDLEQMGSLILSQPHAIEPGASSVELENLFDDGSDPVIIELNPKQTAAENGQAYLKKAAKARKSVPVLERRLAQTDETIEDLERLATQLESVEEPEIDAFRQLLEDRGLIRPRKVRPKQGKADPTGLHPRRYRTSDGWEVWVGRNDSENDRITKSAPRNAIWLHAHGCPGSHVVLRPRDQREPSPEALHDAACLAAYWSKARGSKTVAVNYTEARYVQKPKGAPPGLVTIRNEKTVFVEPREIDRWDNTE